MAKTKKVFFPSLVGNVSPFVDNADEKLNLGALGAKYGISPADIAVSGTFKTNIPLKVSQTESAQASAQALKTERDELIYNARLFYNQMGHTLQKHALYDAADLEALGFFVVETPPDPATAKPVISKATILPDTIILDWVKGAWDGVYVESITEGASTSPSPSPTPTPSPGSGTPDPALWVKIGEDEKSPFEDTRVNHEHRPEVRYYRMRYKKDNKPVGLWSDIAKVIVEIY